MKTRFFLYYELLMFFLFCSGCTLFKTTPDRTRLFDIGFRGTQSAMSSVDSAKICLILGSFPDYLDGSPIITKIGEHELKNNPRYRWAKPLSETILYIVKRSILQSFSKVYVYEFPKDTMDKIDFTLCLDVDGLEICEVTQRIIFKGTWTFLDAKQRNITHAPFEFCESFDDFSDRYGEIVAKVEQVIHHLGDAIVKEMDLIFLKRITGNNP